MNATINVSGKTVSGKTLNEIATILGGELAVDGPRSLVAVVDTGAVVRCSLYCGDSYIDSKNGRTISRW